jgi:L-ornithine N5-oxygenase
MQRIQNSDETQWRCRILPRHAVISASQMSDSSISLRLGVPGQDEASESLDVDYVFAATGYKRDAHEEMLAEIRCLLLREPEDGSAIPVGRDYKVLFDEEKIDRNAGIWLQGCNEGTHGVSSLLFPEGNANKNS